ncbi:MAG TPA: acyl dehydratase [Caulobacteraceae bacterium]|nr:acyl dehydratase [Caulobacteraceae bacterium]
MGPGFDDIEIGQVTHTDTFVLEPDCLAGFLASFAPDWPIERGAPDALTFALWSRLAAPALDGEGAKRLGVDALRWARNPPAGACLRGRITVMGKDPVGEGKGIVIAQHDLLDDEGRLVFSCLTRSLHRRGA